MSDNQANGTDEKQPQSNNSASTEKKEIKPPPPRSPDNKTKAPLK